MKLRKQMVEHPFGTIKFWKIRGLFCESLEKVKAELAIDSGYNISGGQCLGLKHSCGTGLEVLTRFVKPLLASNNDL